MFVLTTVVDRIRIPPHMLVMPTRKALHSMIDQKYPNRVLMNVGLVIGRYGPITKITHGSCVAGDGGSHHECLFRLVVFRPFVEEVVLGTVCESTPEGIRVRLGNFFNEVFVPAYWMLRPSKYDTNTKLWVWSPDYGDEENEEGKEETETNKKSKETVKVETAEVVQSGEKPINGSNEAMKEESTKSDETNEDDGDHFEMEIGAEIRIKIKSIHFTQITNTAKGIQATTTTTAHSREGPLPSKESSNHHRERTLSSVSLEDNASSLPRPARKRSLSVDVTEFSKLPASMQIVASICEDGLGLTSWWENQEDEEEDEEGEDQAMDQGETEAVED